MTTKDPQGKRLQPAAAQNVKSIRGPHPHAQPALREGDQLFRSIFENAQIGISFFSIDGRSIFTNRAFQEMLGYSEQELSRLQDWDKIIHPDERALGKERYAAFFRESVTRMNGNNASFAAMVASSLQTRDSRCCSDAAGEPQYVTSLTEDITERKRAQEERDRVAQQMQMLLESTGQGDLRDRPAGKLHIHQSGYVRNDWLST